MKDHQIETAFTVTSKDLGRDTYCPKCNANFTCRTGDIINCQCNSVPLSNETRDFLARTSVDCLCQSCLQKAEQEIVQVKKKFHRPQKAVLVENLHFYMDGKYCVFTEFYHKQRGYCCKNDCRHCPYRDAGGG